MLEEAVTISLIIGGCAAAAWYAKSKLQPEIERNLEKPKPAAEMQEFIHKKNKHVQ